MVFADTLAISAAEAISRKQFIERIERGSLPIAVIERSVLEEMPVFPGLFEIEEVFTQEEAAANEEARKAHKDLIDERTLRKEVELAARLAARRN